MSVTLQGPAQLPTDCPPIFTTRSRFTPARLPNRSGHLADHKVGPPLR